MLDVFSLEKLGNTAGEMNQTGPQMIMASW